MTSLIGGRLVPKDHERIEAYGSVDELIAFIGLLRDSLDNENRKNLLLRIQDRLMTIASILAADNEEFRKDLPSLADEDTEILEREIDSMEEMLTPINSFILPGGDPVISLCHIARTVCRRAERNVVKVGLKDQNDLMVIKYLNRLSDFLFILSRLISRELHIKEMQWKPNL